jgi:hypothetical protein
MAAAPVVRSLRRMRGMVDEGAIADFRRLAGGTYQGE